MTERLEYYRPDWITDRTPPEGIAPTTELDVTYYSGTVGRESVEYIRDHMYKPYSQNNYPQTVLAWLPPLMPYVVAETPRGNIRHLSDLIAVPEYLTAPDGRHLRITRWSPDVVATSDCVHITVGVIVMRERTKEQANP